jgi:hypothetical protein
MLQEVSWIDEKGVFHREEVNGDPWEFARNLSGSDIIIWRDGKEFDWLENGRSLRNS